MNQLEQIKKALDDINTRRIKMQTLVEQAALQCKSIEEKYGVTSSEQLEQILQDAQAQYNLELQQAQEYITKANTLLNNQGML